MVLVVVMNVDLFVWVNKVNFNFIFMSGLIGWDNVIVRYGIYGLYRLYNIDV